MSIFKMYDRYFFDHDGVILCVGKVGEVTYTEAIRAAFYITFERLTNGGI